MNQHLSKNGDCDRFQTSGEVCMPPTGSGMEAGDGFQTSGELQQCPAWNLGIGSGGFPFKNQGIVV